MVDKVTKRIPGVKTLHSILPKGTEGGKEFARIVDLLLFHEARRAGKKITIFDDSAGDYFGLDSFEGDAFRKEGTTGYQYKFYPSSLSPNHRTDIKKSLKRVAKSEESLELKKWILVTPEDLTESGTRKSGGDVTWFENLRKELGLEFELEHWGHTKLQSLFFETPAICIFYYPELISDGVGRKKTIEDTRQRYYENFKTLYRNIEFVGMSVYKPEATKGIPMEHIYIPLKLMPEYAIEQDANTSIINPLSLLEPGTRSVILGDPGSGKSTLLRFIALAGYSKQLQNRYKANPDNRLPILVTLRSYADELKSNKKLLLIDYIKESIQEKFNLKAADFEFLEYFLETGQTILLFDGLDELPNAGFKKKIKDRIRTLITTYPGNTTVVTSRIVGYDYPFRFDEKEFSHYQLTKLQIPEIEQFVKDWYTVRVENKSEREANVNDLIRILKDDDYLAIRELAENPLLLTIIALVHRIDAVLPDERIILYKKCTETLLNTWHTWKFRAEEVKKKGKVERRNRHRIEAIANWMHTQSGGAKEDQRAIVPYSDLKNFLTKHIIEIEKTQDSENDPEDLADVFLEFVKKRAGLLIEVGDDRYSFIHLTFQEYLASSYIITKGEKDGVASIWKTIKEHCDDSRWHEVIRLLIAGLKSNESQEFLIEKILNECENDMHMTHSTLLGGLLLDGIESAEEHKKEISRHLLHAGSLASSNEQVRLITSMLRTWLIKDDMNEKALDVAFQALWESTSDSKLRMSLVLIASSMNWSANKIFDLIGNNAAEYGQDADLFELFLSNDALEKNHSLMQRFELFWSIQNYYYVKSSKRNFVAVASQAINSSLGLNIVAKRAFEEQMVVLAPTFNAPFQYLILYGLQITFDDQSLLDNKNLNRIRAKARNRAKHQNMDWTKTKALDWGRTKIKAKDLEKVQALALDRVKAKAMALNVDCGQTKVKGRVPVETINFWPSILVSPDSYSPIINILCDTFALKPRPQWWEALRIRFLPKIPQRIKLYDKTMWEQTESAFDSGNTDETEIYSAAWQLIFDSWLYIFRYYESPDESIFSHLADLTREIDEPPLRIAHCIRDLAYGNKKRAIDLVLMVESDDPQYRDIFERCLWRPTPEEEINIKQVKKNSRKKKKKV